MSSKNWSAGDVVSAAELNAVSDQTLMVFADATARNAGFGGAGEPTLAEGMFVFLSGSNEFQVYNGSAWRTIGDPDVLLIDSTNARVGIGTSAPARQLSAKSGSDGGNVVLARTSESDGAYGGVEFHNHPSSETEYRKGALYYRSDGNGYGRGDFLFCQNNDADGGNVDLGDEVVRITAAGLVGIGTDTPLAAVHVEGASPGPQILIKGDNTLGLVQDYAWDSTILFGGYWDGSNQVYGATARAAFKIQARTNADSAAQYLAIYGADQGSAGGTISWNTVGFVQDEDGKVGIGTTSPAYLLDIDEAVADAVPLHVEMSSGGTAHQYLARFSRNAGVLTNGIYCDTGAAYFGTPSDERMKRDIATIDPADSLAAITALRPVDYRYIADPDDGEIRNGLIAQEVEPLIPAAVHTVMETEPRMETVSVPRVETVVDDDGNETTVPVLDEDGNQIIDEDTQPVLGDDGKRIMDTTGDTKMLAWEAVNAHMVGAIKELTARIAALEAAG